jgi:hypothetical protein
VGEDEDRYCENDDPDGQYDQARLGMAGRPSGVGGWGAASLGRGDEAICLDESEIQISRGLTTMRLRLKRTIELFGLSGFPIAPESECPARSHLRLVAVK